jgi:hypothetical protein
MESWASAVFAAPTSAAAARTNPKRLMMFFLTER